ncbi:hypothetical protein LO762_16405 [Actinocorallia sp. API 0066]|uniref:hypothetical protein n=1 Tax=Actinocorallia sp. API 0066 TaxID=2896846 RepID=UPI001E63FEA4|nr:hypothetical protein [Actinocorallia sp. API 0066]MCD0450760.1 hypothetical protein [Actinocorallia sp. API 0066]
MPYPNFRAGQIVTAALLNAGKPEYTMTSGDQANTTTTVADILGLGFWALANAHYLCELWIAYDAPTATDAKFQWWSANGAMERNILALETGTTTNVNSNMMAIRRGPGTAQAVGGPGGTANGYSVYHETSMLHTAGTDGWVTAQFAANASGTATVRDSSLLVYTRLA